LLSAVETAINNYIALDPVAAKRFAELEGRVVGIELRGLDMQLFLLPGREFQVLGSYAGEPDAWISGTPLALVRLSTPAGKRQGMFGDELEIRGDSALAIRFQRLLEKIEVDWEEHLSHLTGDVVAHQLGNLFRGVVRWGQAASESLGDDISEYLREESRLLPDGSEVEQFLSDIDRLRMDVDRMEQRVRRLQEAARL